MHDSQFLLDLKMARPFDNYGQMYDNMSKKRIYRKIWKITYYLRYLCLFTYSGVQHILCCVFVFHVFVLCTLFCQFLWIVHF